MHTPVDSFIFHIILILKSWKSLWGGILVILKHNYEVEMFSLFEVGWRWVV